MIQLSKSVAIFFIWVTIISFTTEENLRYILMWKNDIAYTHNNRINTRRDNGRQIFIDNQCIYNNCYITDDRDLFGIGEITKFHALVFNGHELSMFTTLEQLPKKRLQSQKYMLVCAEPKCLNMSFVCNPILQAYFNMTYSLSKNNYEIHADDPSELALSYGPQPRRRHSDSDIDYTFCKNHLHYDETLLLRNKKKAVAWFMSNCSNSDEMMGYVMNLTIFLNVLSQTLDIYGCGHLECPKLDNSSKCDDELRDEYYFYLDFENSILKKTNRCPLAKLANNSVPIFYRFDTKYLPLGTYLDAWPYLAPSLASEIVYLINTPKRYRSYFMSRNRNFTYFPVREQIFPCKLCSSMNSKVFWSKPHACNYPAFTKETKVWCAWYEALYRPKRVIG